MHYFSFKVGLKVCIWFRVHLVFAILNLCFSCQMLTWTQQHRNSRNIFSWHWFRFCSWGALFQACISRRNWDIKNCLGFTATHYQFQIMSSVPALATACVLFATIPVTVASAERSFSKLKLIKTYLRSSISQETWWTCSSCYWKWGCRKTEHWWLAGQICEHQSSSS